MRLKIRRHAAVALSCIGDLLCIYPTISFKSFCFLSSKFVPRYQNCFHGVDLCQLREQALNEYLRQPIVDTFDIGICLAKSIRYSLDFMTAEEKDLHHLGKSLDLGLGYYSFFEPQTL